MLANLTIFLQKKHSVYIKISLKILKNDEFANFYMDI